MNQARSSLVACALLVFGAFAALAQTADPKPRREPPVAAQPADSPSMAATCARQQREREKRIAQGLPVDPISRTSPCRTLAAPPQIRERPLQKVDTPNRKTLPDAAGDNRRRRVQQNTGGGEPPKLR